MSGGICFAADSKSIEILNKLEDYSKLANKMEVEKMFKCVCLNSQGVGGQAPPTEITTVTHASGSIILYYQMCMCMFVHECFIILKYNDWHHYGTSLTSLLLIVHVGIITSQK